MALPDPENLAYEGQTSGKAKCMAWGGFFCIPQIVIQSWKEIVRFSLYLTRTFKTILER